MLKMGLFKKIASTGKRPSCFGSLLFRWQAQEGSQRPVISQPLGEMHFIDLLFEIPPSKVQEKENARKF